MCRICQYISDSQKDIEKLLIYFEEEQQELLLEQQQIIDPLVELLFYIYPRKEKLLNNFLVISTRRSKKLPIELIVIIKNYLLEDLKEINREILLNKKFISQRKLVLKTLEEFLSVSLCQQQ